MRRRKLLIVIFFLATFFVVPAHSNELVGEILFYSEAQKGGQLYILNLESKTIRPVGRSGSRPDHYPRWSHDGKKIVFESYRAGGWHPWMMNADGSGARRISNAPAYNTKFYEFDPSFAPDGNTIIFVRNFDLYSVTLSDETPRRIGRPTQELLESSPVFSPDMKRIAFDAYRREDETVHIYIVHSDGDALQQLTMGESKNMAPVWSPDGSKILFYSDRDGSMELYEIEVSSKEIRKVIQAKAAKEAGFTKAALVDPWDNDNGATLQYRASYSPDGRWIVFSRDINRDRELFITNAAGTEIRQILSQKGHDGFPEWRPN
ncbi:MAG: hypothetical protein DHS20C05_02950 [Hyphococcus sp.]|nr:MAG: hypothetical protein DHS20C05_02950 [Marinicaulis sp.]